MKKRHDILTRVVAAVMTLAVAAVIAINLYNRAVHLLVISRASEMTVRRELEAEGYIIREETALRGSARLSAPELRDGEKASAGALVATSYPSGTDESALALVREYKQRIAALRDLAERGASERERRSELAVSSLASALAQRDLGRASELSVAAESLVFAGTDSAAPETELRRLEAEVASLTAALRGGTGVYAPRGGVYSSETDGFENVTPAMVYNVTPSTLRGIFETPGNTDGAGTIVYGVKWYIAVIIPSAEAGAIRERRDVRVNIPRIENGDFYMDVADVGAPENGECVVLLSCGDRIADTFGNRSAVLYILFGEDSGYAVPKEAVRLSESGQTQVFIAVSRVAVSLDVEIIRELGEIYLVAPEPYTALESDSEEVRKAKRNAASKNAERTAYLRDGAEIITHANNLADGKVIR